nr:putative harbinger transposase-derived protein [Tanacetum cinerariifolium]
MNSYTYMGLDDVEEGEEISSRKKNFIKRALAYIKIRRQANELTRNSITRDRSGAHERLQKQESARKDVKRAFGVLKKKRVILANLTRALKKERIVNMMYTCIILHNMIRKYNKVAISPKWFPEEAHQSKNMLRNEEQVQQVMRWIISSQVHQYFRHDLIEHLSRNV